jgi:hypothetical protein
MIDHEQDANRASRFGWFSAGALSALAALAAFFFLGNHLFSASGIADSAPSTIIEAQ